jgi:hypothetical protein
MPGSDVQHPGDRDGAKVSAAGARRTPRAAGWRPGARIRRLIVLLAITTGMIILAAGAAFAYFQTTDHANPAAALGATLTAPTGGTQNGTNTPSTIAIRWTAPAGYTPTGYIVLRCTGSSCSPATSPVVGGCSSMITSVVTATSCIDSDPALVAGTSYTYAVQAVLDNWTSPASAAFTASTTAVAKLSFTTQPSVNQDVEAKGTGVFSVAVAITDSAGAEATNDNTDTVTLAIGTNPGSGVLSCTDTGGLTVTAVGGVASFTGCAITRAGTGYTLTAASATGPSLTAPSNANAFNVIAGAAVQLGFTLQPSVNQNIQAAGTGSFPVSVAVQDQDGNTVTADSGRSVTLAIGNNPGGGVLSCTNTGGLTVTDGSGVASFTGCAITLSGTGYKLTAATGSLAAPTNANAFNITAGAASQLTFTAQPSVNQNIQAAGTGSFSASVAVQDRNGNTVAPDGGRLVTLGIGTNAGGGVLSCTNTGGLSVTDSAGVASFTGCAITLAGTGYTLTASSPGLAAPSNANAFNIVAGVASQLSFTAQPSVNQNIQATGTGSFSASVAVQDRNGNTLTGDGGRSITLAIGTNPGGGVLSCTNTGGLTVTDSAGVASFTGCAITKVGTGYQLTASATSMTAPTNANPFNVTAGAPAYLGFTNITVPLIGSRTASCTPNVGAHSNTCTFSSGIVGLVSYTATVSLYDQNGNLAPAASGGVSVSLSSPAPSGVSPATVSIVGGATTSASFTETLGLGGLGVITASAPVGSPAVTFTGTLTPGL